MLHSAKPPVALAILDSCIMVWRMPSCKSQTHAHLHATCTPSTRSVCSFITSLLTRCQTFTLHHKGRGPCMLLTIRFTFRKRLLLDDMWSCSRHDMTWLCCSRLMILSSNDLTNTGMWQTRPSITGDWVACDTHQILFAL